MSDPGPSLPYRSGHRQEFLDAMLAELVRTATADGRPFALGTRALDDPTVALLDAWATVADVVAFYQARIANEGFVGTATQPGSLLAIAQLTGYTPRPGLAASLWLAYSLQPDPADTAVVLPAGLLAQSVPGTGELPQTFETTAELVARPSWNTLGVQASGPLPVPSGGVGNLAGLAVAGVTTGLAANAVILLADSTGAMTPVTVQTVAVDLTNQVTTVTLQPPGGASSGADPPAAAGAASSSGAGASLPGTPITRALDQLLPALLARPAPPPVSASALNRKPSGVFPPGSSYVVGDNLVRLVAALNPNLAATVYKALGTTPIGPATVTGAEVMQVAAAPFGVRMPPRPVFNTLGQPLGTEEWPIGDVQSLSLAVQWNTRGPLGAAQISVEGPGGLSGATRVNDVATPADTPVELTGVDGAAVGSVTVTSGASALTVTYSPPPGSSPLGRMELRVSSDDTPDFTFDVTFTPSQPGGSDATAFTWAPELQGPRHFTLGNQRVTLNWPAVGAAGPDGEDDPDAVLTVLVAEALPLTDASVLDLDTVYPGILPGTSVVIDGPPGAAPGYPLVARVDTVTTTAVSRYGMSGTVTELTLDQDWVDPNARWLSALRPLTVQAQPAPLTLRPVARSDPLPDPAAPATIDLDGLYAGIEAGQRIVVTGTRIDLPGGATVAAGEPAMVKAVSQTTAGAGDAPHTTLELAGPLAYAYGRGSVQIYGNVVVAHQGSTVTEALTGATPGAPHPAFTLSQAPVLADPSSSAAGYTSTLQVTVNGVVWTPSPRLDAATPARGYLTGIDGQGRTTVTLSGPLPTGTSRVVATYRAGQGSRGNVRAGQVTQLLSRPLTVAGVTNPLPGSGGSDGDGPADLGAGASVGLVSMGRIVTVDDLADLARGWSGVGQARAVATTDGRGDVVALTVAGVDPVDFDPAGPVGAGLARAIAAGGEPAVPVVVVAANLYLIVASAAVLCDPAFDWTDVSTDVQAALFAAFGYSQRRLGADLVLSEVVAVAHSVPGVDSFSVTGVALVATTATATDISLATTSLAPPPASGRMPLPTSPPPSGLGLAFLSDALTDTLILEQVRS